MGGGSLQTANGIIQKVSKLSFLITVSYTEADGKLLPTDFFCRNFTTTPIDMTAFLTGSIYLNYLA